MRNERRKMIRMAFAGFRHGHIYALYKLAERSHDIVITAACEEDGISREAAERTVGVKFTHKNHTDMLNDKSIGIDVVAIGDYFGRRGAIAIAALRSGRHVYSDKPLCTSLTELDQIEKLSRDRDLKVGLMLDMRYNKAVQPVRGIIKEGKLGEVHNIFFGGQHPLLYGSRPGWYFEDGKHGGTINDIAVHGIDLIGYLTGLSLKRVIGARSWNAYAKETPAFKDCAQFMIELTNGAGLMADVSYSAPDSSGYGLPFYWRFTIWGTKGVLEFCNSSKEIVIALNGRSGVETVTVPDTDTGNCLDVFLDELEGRTTDIDTASVIKASRDTLLIQQRSNGAEDNYAEY
jgi:predicted dehydrogenase